MDSPPKNESQILKVKSNIANTKEDLIKQTKDLQQLIDEIVGNEWVPDDAIFFQASTTDWTSQLILLLNNFGEFANQLHIEE